MTLDRSFLKSLAVECVQKLSAGIIICAFMCYLIWSFLQAMLREDEIRQHGYITPAAVEVIDWQKVADKEAIQRAHDFDVMSDQERMRGVVLEPDF